MITPNALKHATALIFKALVAVSAASSVGVVFAQTYPDRPVSIVVGFAPGGAFDSVMRSVAEEMSKTLGQRVNVDNRPGAGGAIATQAVIAAAPDGHTLLAAGLQLGTGPHLNKVNYDPNADLTMVGQIVSVPVFLLVRTDSPVNDAKDLVALSKKNGNGVSIGSGGVGTTGHFGALMLETAINAPVVHVPFKGGAPGLLALMAGEIDAMFDQPSGVLQGLLQSGKLRAVAVMQSSRHPLTPNVKSAPEFGLTLETPLRGWQGLAVRTGTPPAVVQKLSAAIAAAVASPAFKKKMEQLDLELITTTSPEAFQKLYLSELTRWGAFIKKHKITAQ
ncbi:MAG: tripartite tricarboxylate transporter substrate binding protein [Rhizobacter sp.]|nr:tripartite tricarboxylate transporter substrate binding protein [Burkholderiales bacterium]